MVLTPYEIAFAYASALCRIATPFVAMAFNRSRTSKGKCPKG